MEAQTSDRQHNRRGVAIMAATALGLVVAVPATASAGQAQQDDDGRIVEGDPTCEDIQPDVARVLEEELEIDPPSDGEHSDEGGLTVNLTVNDTPDGQTIDWESDAGIGVDAVIVKGGPNATVYKYDPEATEDSGLHAPLVPESERFADIRHVSFCYDFVFTDPTPFPPTTPTTSPEPEVAPAVDAQPTFTG